MWILRPTWKETQSLLTDLKSDSRFRDITLSLVERLNSINVSKIYLENTVFQSLGGGSYLTILIKNLKLCISCSQKTPPLGIYPVKQIGRALRSVGTTMFTSASEKIKMVMNVFILCYIHKIKVFQFYKVMM